MSFSGFPRDTLYTPVPNPLFGPLLEQIQELAELKVTLRGLWLLHRRRGWPQVVYQREFLNDPSLLRGLRAPGRDSRDEIRRGLELAVARGTFLLLRPGEDPAAGQVYLLNTDAGRSALAKMRREGIPVEAHGQAVPKGLPEDFTQEPPGEKPNIFALYENNVGTLSPLLAEQLKEAEQMYSPAWITQAFKIAVAENKRSWRYVAGILRRWAAEGKDDGKPGGYSQKDNRQKYLEDYQRRWSRSP